MKKLLLLLIGLFSFFGFSFASFSTYSINPAGSLSNNTYRGTPFMCNLDYCQLLTVNKVSASTCNNWALLNSSYTILQTGVFVGTSATINANLTENQKYIFVIGSGNFITGATTCEHKSFTINSLNYIPLEAKNDGYNVASIFPGNSTFVPNTSTSMSISSNNYTQYTDFTTFVFSGTPFARALPNYTTIHYNGTTTSFTGTDIRLTNLFAPYTMSGSDIVFTPYVLRALFRRP